MILGLELTGKTTILYRIVTGQTINTVATIAPNEETVIVKDTKLAFFDVGGQEKLRPFWRHYYAGTKGVIFVVNADDQEHQTAEKAEFIKALSELPNIPFLILANFTDAPNSRSEEQITEHLELSKISGREWTLKKCCGFTGDGINEGIEWLVDHITF